MDVWPCGLSNLLWRVCPYCAPFTALHCTALHCAALHCTALQTSAGTILCKVQVATPKGRDGLPAIYNDFLSLIQIEEDGPWVIASKIFAAAPVSRAELSRAERSGAELY
jgi:hypothetical protein